MTSTTQQRPTEVGPGRSRVWSNTRVLATDVPVAEITERLAGDRSARAWWWVPRSMPALRPTAELFGLDNLAVDDVLSEREPPKVDTLGGSVLLIGALVCFDPQSDQLRRDPVAILATDRMLAVVADEPAAVRLTQRLVDNAGALAADGVAAGLHLLLDTMVHAETKAVLAMEDAADELTTSLFDDKPMNRADQLRAFRLRQSIAALRRVTAPLAEILLDLSGAAARTGGPDDPLAELLDGAVTRRMQDVCDHAQHAANETNTLRELLSSAYETNLALSDVHLNVIMKKLSAWAAIIAVPTLITGFLGMNVPYPGFGDGQGFLAGLTVMVLAVLTLFVLFKRKGWL